MIFIYLYLYIYIYIYIFIHRLIHISDLIYHFWGLSYPRNLVPRQDIRNASLGIHPPDLAPCPEGTG